MNKQNGLLVAKRTSFISLRRICVIASHTFTQLVRMKVFYFLIVFALILLAMRQLVFGTVTGGDSASEQELRLLKSTSFFAMNLFASLMALTSTALLIPKDLEERTLYTILCKPVPRLDYLIGKLAGVLALIFISLLVMHLMMSIALHLKCQELIESESAMLGARYSEDIVQARVAELKQHGPTIGIHYATLAIFLKASLIASIALLISTFSSSTIFTLILTVIIVLIGMMVAEAREFTMQRSMRGQFVILSKLTYIISIIIPDFQLLSIDNGAIDGKKISHGLMLQITLFAFFYTAIYTILSWFTFRKKEF